MRSIAEHTTAETSPSTMLSASRSRTCLMLTTTPDALGRWAPRPQASVTASAAVRRASSSSESAQLASSARRSAEIDAGSTL